MKRLPDTELEVMKALWASGPDTPRAALEEALAPFGWAANTINTYLTRLADKGFVRVHRDRKGNRYTPLVGLEEYQAFDSRAALSRLYGKVEILDQLLFRRIREIYMGQFYASVRFL